MYAIYGASIGMFFICNLIFLHVTFDITLIYCYITKLFNMNEKLFDTYVKKSYLIRIRLSIVHG